MRGRSYSPSPPPRGYGRRGRSPSPRDRYGSRARDMPTSLLVRNLRHDCRPEDLRRNFERFGALKDVYLPKDYYTGEPRGFGFVQYVDPADAAEAKYQMDGQILLGRELAVVFAEENRKKPTEMRSRERVSSHRVGRHRDRKRSPPLYSRSPPPRRGRSRSRSRDYHSPPPKKRYHSRSVSPEERRYSRDRSYSPSPPRNGSRSRSRSADRGGQVPSRIADRGRPPSRSRSRSPRRSESPRHVRRPSRSRSPPRAVNRDRSPPSE